MEKRSEEMTVQKHEENAHFCKYAFLSLCSNFLLIFR